MTVPRKPMSLADGESGPKGQNRVSAYHGQLAWSHCTPLPEMGVEGATSMGVAFEIKRTLDAGRSEIA
jgi:hypothetical protein